MKSDASVVKTNLVYGLIALIPISIIFLVLVTVADILEAVADSLGLRSTASAGVAIVLALLLLVGLCFIVGALVRTRIGSLSMAKLEQTIFNQIPGYKIASNILRGFLEKEAAFPPAMIRLHDAGTAALGFVMEDNNNGVMTVFIPASPAVTVGNVYVVASDRVTILNASPVDLLDCLSQWGAGSGKYLQDAGLP